MELLKPKVGIVVCSRADSKRVPRKPFALINGLPLLAHLIRRLLMTGYPVYIAVPHRDFPDYRKLLDEHFGEMSPDQLMLLAGSAEDPLARMARVAEEQKLDYAVRVCHDKIFVVPEWVQSAVDFASARHLGYVYTRDTPDGTAFEVIDSQVLMQAAQQFKGVEHISYAVRCVTNRLGSFTPAGERNLNHRLLVDYPEDIQVLELVTNAIGNDGTLDQALYFMECNSWVSDLNRTPVLTVYTCARNAEHWIERAMGSVAGQKEFGEFEYILVDDFSTDRTPYLMAKFCERFPNSRWIRNPKNLGLASSSNVALSQARGRFIMRVDADDYLLHRTVAGNLISHLTTTGADVVYPDNVRNGGVRQRGRDHHHVGGAMFRTRAANHVKFTEGLRGYEGYDFFERAKDQLQITYWEEPTFFYRKTKGSLSHGDPESRAQIKADIDARLSQGDRAPVS